MSVLVPEDRTVVGLRLHDNPAVAVKARAIMPVKPFCGETVIMAVAVEPLLKLSDETFAVIVNS